VDSFECATQERIWVFRGEFVYVKGGSHEKQLHHWTLAPIHPLL